MSFAVSSHLKEQGCSLKMTAPVPFGAFCKYIGVFC